MFEIGLKFDKVVIDAGVVARAAPQLADDLTRLLIAQNQLALLHYHKKVSGDTLLSVSGRTVQATTSFIHKQVVAGAGYKFILSGRKSGRKMPVRYIGVGVRGGKIFEPVPLLLRWFLLKGIPREAWFPIMRSIVRRGIRPVPVDQHAMRQSAPHIKRLVRQTSNVIMRGIIRHAN